MVGSTSENLAIPGDPDPSDWRLSMVAKLKLSLVAVVLSGFFVVQVPTGAPAAVPVDPLGLTAAETQEFKDLIDPAAWDMNALVVWLETLRGKYLEPGRIGELSVDLALLVEDENPNKDTILALLQDMLATAAGPRGYILPADVSNLSENPCTSSPSPLCNN